MAECNANGVCRVNARSLKPKQVRNSSSVRNRGNRPDERLALPAKGARGDLAFIELADLGPHWIWATGFQLWSGDFSGCSAPLMDPAPTPYSNCRAPSRAAAIDAACAHLRHRLTERAQGCPDARAVLAWLAALVPDQLDIFGAVA